MGNKKKTSSAPFSHQNSLAHNLSMVGHNHLLYLCKEGVSDFHKCDLRKEGLNWEEKRGKVPWLE
jgi:hypothetical protein